MEACTKRLGTIRFKGDFDKTKKRTIVFLDTYDETIRLNGFVFRQRSNRVAEYTLKCRSPDSHVAISAHVKCGKNFKNCVKVEDDIAPPFSIRFSHSNTVRGPGKAPKTLKGAAKIFPVLAKLERDGERCMSNLPLRPVNALKAYERVVTGPILSFSGTKAEVALILWSDGPGGRPLVVEFSFRFKIKGKKGLPANSAKLAMEFFNELQLLDWSAPQSRTKTQYVYRSLPY